MMQYLRSLQWIDYYFYVFVEPRRLTHLLEIASVRHFMMGFFSIVLVSVIDIITGALLVPQTGFFYYAVTYGWILRVLIILTSILVYAGLLDMVFQYYGYQGSVRKLVPILSISLFPQVLLLPSVYIFKTFNFAPLFFNALFSVILTIWSLMIAVQCIAELHKMDFFRALVLTLLPVVMLGIIFFFVFLLIVFLLMGYVA